MGAGKDRITFWRFGRILHPVLHILMKTHLFLAAALMVTLAGCDQKNSAVDDLQRKNAELQAKLEEQERAAKLKAAEDLAAQQMAANDEAARKLAADRDALEAQMAQLTATQKAAEAERFQLRQQALKAEEQRIADARAQSARQAEEARERARMRDVRPAAERRTLDLFYDQLDPYGDWLEVEGYGFVFHPTVARDRDWRPYVDGSWLRSDQGWVWKSNEPFGWATYHYGRWIRLNKRGWVWVPGSEWAPAWVAWRANEDYVGWAPLPPEAYSPNGFNFAVDDYYDIGAGSYVFVTRRNFIGGNSYVGRGIDLDRNGRIVAETENVTNISYQQMNQQTVIVNEGPSLASVSGPGAAPVATFKVHRIEAGNPHEHPTATAAGVLSIFAPALLHQLQTKPRQVRSREPYEVNRGWKEIPPDMQARIREKNATEARQLEARQRSGVIVAPPPTAPRNVPQTPVASPVTAPPGIRHGVPKPGMVPPEPGGLRPRQPAPAAAATPPAPVIPPAQTLQPVQNPAVVPIAPIPAPSLPPAPVVKPERKRPEAAPVVPVVKPEPKPSVIPPVAAPVPPAPLAKPETTPAIVPPVPAPAPAAPPAPVVKPEHKKPEVEPAVPVVKPEPKPAAAPPVAPPVPAPFASGSKPERKPEVIVPVPVPANPSAPLIISAPKPVVIPPVPVPAPEPAVPPASVIKPERKPEIVPPTPAVKTEPKPVVVPPAAPAPAAPPAPVIKPERKPEVVPPASVVKPESMPAPVPALPVPTPPPVPGGIRKPEAP